MQGKEIKAQLDYFASKYNRPEFIKSDPISIPRRFTRKQDIEISGFWTAVLSWGLRQTIINKAVTLMNLMDNSPYDFIINHEEKDRKRFLDFKHRTFNATDTIYFVEFFQSYYKNHESLEEIFIEGIKDDIPHVGPALSHFYDQFFSLPNFPERTRKHIADPRKKSRCKRINMFLRWMVRQDENGVDFGLWKSISPSQLLIPLDVHVERVARSFNLIRRKQNDFRTVVELTENLKKFRPEDPVYYDYALFGIGVMQKKDLLA